MAKWRTSKTNKEIKLFDGKKYLYGYRDKSLVIVGSDGMTCSFSIKDYKTAKQIVELIEK